MRQSASRIISAQIIRHLRSDDLAHEAHDADRVRELQEVMLGDAILARTNVVFTPHIAFNSTEAVSASTAARWKISRASSPGHR
jgi:lactate dehydrogenase-like 2-hydroxyacid dehydrogenase